jgi:hypothetical protein
LGTGERSIVIFGITDFSASLIATFFFSSALVEAEIGSLELNDLPRELPKFEPEDIDALPKFDPEDIDIELLPELAALMGCFFLKKGLLVEDLLASIVVKIASIKTKADKYIRNFIKVYNY